MMKKLLLLLTSITFLFSCSVDEDIKIPEKQTGTVSFSFSDFVINKDSSSQAKKLVDATPKAIYITIDDANGTSMLENPKLNLLSFGNGYITDEIELPVGDYEIITFNVLDENDGIIYACPQEGSEYSSYVNNPLPISFNVTADDSSTVSPEVIAVTETTTPEQFGYTSFSFTIVDIIDEPITQDLYIQILNQNGESLEEWVSLSMDVSIPSLNYTATEYLDHGVNLIEIPATDNGVEINITVFAESYDEKSFVLNSDIINGHSDGSPYIVTFGNDVIVPDTIVEFINSTEAERYSYGNEFTFDYSFYSIEHIKTTVDGRNNILIAASSGDFQNFVLVEVSPEDDQKYIAYEFKIKDDYIHDVIKVGDTFILVGSQMYRYESSTSATELNFTTISHDNDIAYSNFYVNENSNTIYSHDSNLLYRSDDLGDTFELVNDSLPFYSLYGEAITFIDDLMLVIDDGEIYQSFDQGVSFYLNSDLDTAVYDDIAYINGMIHVFGDYGYYAVGSYNQDGIDFTTSRLYTNGTDDPATFIGVTNLIGRIQILYTGGFFQKYEDGEIYLISDDYINLSDIAEDYDNNLIWSISYDGGGKINWHYGNTFF